MGIQVGGQGLIWCPMDYGTVIGVPEDKGDDPPAALIPGLSEWIFLTSPASRLFSAVWALDLPECHR